MTLDAIDTLHQLNDQAAELDRVETRLNEIEGELGIRSCEQCATVIEAPQSRQRYCGDVCRRRGGRPKKPYFCEWCGGLFWPYRKVSRFCSMRCRAFGSGEVAGPKISATLTGRGSGPPYYSRTDNRWIVNARSGGNVLWARVVMQNELGRPLQHDEHVHHINGDPSDDRVVNLQVLSASEHARLHWYSR